MEPSGPYFPHGIFLPEAGSGHPSPRVFVAPQRYVQGVGVLYGVGRYVSMLDARHADVLMSRRAEQGEGRRLVKGLEKSGITSTISTFNGECSIEEITLHAKRLRDVAVDCLIAVGGGKCVDAGKGVAFRLGIPIVVVPSLASNDAPCSALSVLYSPEGVSNGVEFYPNNPAFVVVDTAVVAAASERYLVSGMGDAMATWYEAQVCYANPSAVIAVGTRPTIAAAAIGEACARTLFADGVNAASAVARSEVTAELEQIVEANTLLSGLGFESGGLAAAHAFAQAYTSIPRVETNFLHGEMVAMGTLSQLMLENRQQEARKVAEFFVDVGLPVHLGQLSVDNQDSATLDTIVQGALTFPYIGNMPMVLDEGVLRTALLEADALGLGVSADRGDAAFRKLQSE
jgi:glycerol dehydrogenase